MTQSEKYDLAVNLLKELNCPDAIMDELWTFGMFVRDNDIKLHNWQALAGPGVVEGEGREIE
jgi:hypothetical protein